jgi:hypothetical protein
MPDSVTPISKSSLQSQQPKMEQRSEPSTSGVIENPPPAAAKLAKGIVLEAIVTSSSNQNGSATAVISKAPISEVIGDEISLKTSAALKEGAQVTIQITENRSGDLAIRIVQVETPESVAKNIASSTPASQLTTTNIQTQAVEESVTLAKQQSIQAIVIKGSSSRITEQQIAQRGIANLPLPDGANLDITIKGIYPQTEAIGASGAAQPITPTQSAATTTETLIPNTPPTPNLNAETTTSTAAAITENSSPITQGTTVLPTGEQKITQSMAIQQYAKSAQSAKPQYPQMEFNSPKMPIPNLQTQQTQESLYSSILADKTPNALETIKGYSPPPPIPQGPNILSGTIEAIDIGGKTIIDIGTDKISLASNIKASVGSRIDMEITKVILPTFITEQHSSLSSLIEPAGGLDSSGWPALNDAKNILRSENPVILQSLESAIPKPGPQFTSTMLSFIKAAQTGNIEAWLGSNPLNALRNSGGLGEQVLSRLDRSIKEISKKNRMPNSSTKANLTIPINADGQGISAISMIVMRNKNNEDAIPTEQAKADTSNGSRFLINVCTSAFGDMQFDGLVFSNNRVLELVIKTRKPLAKQMQNEIIGMFTNSLSALNYSGKAVFQVTQTFFIPNRDEATASTHHLDDLTV